MKTFAVLFVSLIHFAAFAQTAAQAQAKIPAPPAPKSQKLQLVNRIELQIQNSRAVYKQCKYQGCTVIGKAAGYTGPEIQQLFETQMKGHGPAAQLMVEAVTNSDSGFVAAPFFEAIESNESKLVLAICPLTAAMKTHLAKFRDSNKDADYVFNIEDFQKFRCSATFGEGSPDMDQLAKEVGQILR